MADATWSVEWGDATWGEGEAAASLGIVDMAGNPMTSGSQVSCAGYVSDDSAYSSNRIYDAHIQSLRDTDFSNGGLFWKRYCEGPEQVRINQNSRILSLGTLANVNKISDENVGILPLTYGWDQISEREILSRIAPDRLRLVIASSHDLWERRGASGSIVEVLNVVAGVRAFEFDWFDDRWVLGENSLNDIIMMSVDGRRESQILIDDPTKKYDRILLTKIVQKWRASGERITLTWVDFVDYFNDLSQGWQAQSGTFSIDAGARVMSIPGGPTSRIMVPDERSDLANSILKTVVQFTGNSEFGILARSNSSGSGVEALVSALDTARIVSNGVTLASGTLESLGIFLNSGFDVDLRVHIHETVIELFVNEQKVLEAADPSIQNDGLCGIYADTGTSLSVQSFEALPLPGDNIYIGLNGETRVFPA